MNNDKKVLSLIIPVYNSEKYLKECLQSVFNQCDKNLEVIVVNDGSTDSSRDIIESFSSIYDVIVIDKYNSGVASARNVGIEKASGEYITFLDSDDVWCDGIYDEIIKNIYDSEKIDCLIFDYYKFYSEHKMESIKQEITKNSIEYIRVEIAKFSHWFLWRFIFKSEFYKKNKFLEGRRFEDQLMLPKLMYSAKSIKKVDVEIISYRKNIDSITNNLKLSDLDDSQYCIIKYLDEFYKKPNKYWSIVLANLYLSHVSKCARIYHQNPKVAHDSYKKVNDIIPLKVIIKSANIKALIYYCSLRLLFIRLIRKVKSESI
ncbi:glycosyltransferase family 2 protein [Aeromonas veronii]|uniref:glycosyltransferase family 2 protein n=1 Tax=Aeromonas veronii TaxID=654 RepID=UPI0030DF2611